jgi:hypothetical protein
MEIRKNFILTISILLMVSGLSFKSYAGWSGPSTVVTATWGKATGQVGLEHGDTFDIGPQEIGISNSGKVIIGDEENVRIESFDSDGTLITSFTFQSMPEYASQLKHGWPLSLFVSTDQCIVSQVSKYTQIYDINGNLIHNLTSIKAGLIYADQGCNLYAYSPAAKSYYIFNNTGTLLTTTSSRPMELGIVTGKCLTGKFLSECKNIKYSIEYPDAIYVYQEGTRYADFSGQVRIGTDTIMDNQSGYVYAFSVTQTTTISGSKPIKWLGWIATWTKPSDVYGAPVNDGVETIAPVVAQYGSPIIGPDGSIYCWKRTQTNYLILKWTWSP